MLEINVLGASWWLNCLLKSKGGKTGKEGQSPGTKGNALRVCYVLAGKDLMQPCIIKRKFIKKGREDRVRVLAYRCFRHLFTFCYTVSESFFSSSIIR